jgi:hypothetical protein
MRLSWGLKVTFTHNQRALKMASIYSAKCSSCGNPPQAHLRCQPLFEVDSKGSCYFHDGGVVYLGELRGMIELPHPGEAGMLRTMGTSFSETRANGKLFSKQTVVCNSCGLVCENLQTMPKNDGCLLSAVFGISLGLSAGYFGQLGWIASLMIAFFGIAILSWIMERVHKWRNRSQDDALWFDKCPTCGDQDLRPISNIVDIALPCSHCKKHTLVFEFFARS